jgi:hypothetical protein
MLPHTGQVFFEKAPLYDNVKKDQKITQKEREIDKEKIKFSCIYISNIFRAN